tara:strand:+ start:113 stop:772 length:660 start_codon:yes stop_codon:yes gene_type:complete
LVKKFLNLILNIVFIFLFSSKAWCIEETLVFLALQKGKQDTASTAPGLLQKDSYYSSLENKHGSLNEKLEVKPTVFSFDFYKINGNFASGFGLEMHSYKKSYSFGNEGTSINISAVGILYGLNFYYRGDFWFPFVGFGTGNYSAKVKEELKTDSNTSYGTVFGQVDKPFFYKFGLRIPLNGFGIIITQQYISANMKVDTENKPLSLGGIGSFLGIYYGF